MRLKCNIIIVQSSKNFVKFQNDQIKNEHIHQTFKIIVHNHNHNTHTIVINSIASFFHFAPCFFSENEFRRFQQRKKKQQ